MERHPWFARALFDAFGEAKEQIEESYVDPGHGTLVGFPWVARGARGSTPTSEVALIADRAR